MKFLLPSLAFLSFALNLWQWLAARCCPLHQRVAALGFTPAVTLLKPLKGCDANTADCLRSWLTQNYSGTQQILFGVADAADPVCELVRNLLREFPHLDAQLIICHEVLGTNAKVSTLAQLERHARHEILVISDADVLVPPDFLTHVVAPLRDEKIGLVNCFYRLANPANAAMRLEAITINADFWSQVLQAQSLAPLDFALGAAMATRRRQLAELGGFTVMADCLADDYQLGHRLVQRGHCIELSPIVVECWDKPMGWREVWRHQLRWARTVRVSKPAGYFFSVLANATLWPLLWWFGGRSAVALEFFGVALGLRVLTALHLQGKLAQNATALRYGWLVPVKDLFQVAVWLAAFAGNTIEWRGQKFHLRRDGTMVKA